MSYFCYLLECNDGSYYCGWTIDLKRRLSTHNKGRGSRYTRMRLPVKLVYYEEMANRVEAMKREQVLKKLKHDQKKVLAESWQEHAI